MSPDITKILVVDDEPSMQSIIKQKFKKYIADKKIEFIFALNGVEALEKIHQDTEIGIVLTDINMPEMDGLTLLDRLSDLSQPYRTIVISAYGDMRNIRSAMNKGASDFITKPIDLNDLEITVKHVIEQYSNIKKTSQEKIVFIEINKELSIAKDIQQSFIPHHFDIEDQKLTILGEMIPAKEVGGDFFDYFTSSNHLHSFVIADVAGKGIPASLFMCVSRTLLRSIGVHNATPQACINETNQILSQNNEMNMFLTAFYCTLDSNTGLLTYCNAGHLPPYLLGADNSVTKFSLNEGMALGFYNDIPNDKVHTEKSMKLNKGDIIFLYTDGVTEATDESGELYGFERLEVYLKTASRTSLPELIKGVKEDILKFTKGAKQSDDIAIFCIRYNG